MRSWRYDDLEIGLTGSFERTVDETMMCGFLQISGDNNPLHCDEKFALQKGFAGRVVYGMLVASLYSCLAGVYLPGKNCLLQSVHSDFLRPVFIGDILTVTGKIAEKNDSVRQIVIKASIRNQKGEKVSKANIELGVL